MSQREGMRTMRPEEFQAMKMAAEGAEQSAEEPKAMREPERELSAEAFEGEAGRTEAKAFSEMKTQKDLDDAVDFYTDEFVAQGDMDTLRKLGGKFRDFYRAQGSEYDGVDDLTLAIQTVKEFKLKAPLAEQIKALVREVRAGKKTDAQADESLRQDVFAEAQKALDAYSMAPSGEAPGQEIRKAA